jgi:hypothetical protein
VNASAIQGVAVPLGKMEAVKALVCEWSEYWRTAAEPPKLSWPADLGERPRRPTPDQLRRVCATFKVHGGRSFDSCNPRDFGVLDDAGLEALADVTELVEQQYCWPDFINKLAFVPKREGGVRPIALLAALVRVHGRLRRPIATVWEATHNRGYWWAPAGKSCDRAVWQQLVWSEWVSMKID